MQIRPLIRFRLLQIRQSYIALRFWFNMAEAMKAVVFLAWLSFGTSLIILFSPLGSAGQELAARGTLSGAVSGVFAIILGIIAIIVATRVHSSDYKAEEDVKAQTAQLLACMRSITLKGIVNSQKPTNATHPITFTKEKEVINSFLSSTTAFAYWSWISYKSERAAPGQPEEWRIFFLNVAGILDSDDSLDFRKMIAGALAIENLLTGLSEADVQKISGYVSNLSRAFGKFRQSRDFLIDSAKEVYSRTNPELIRDKLLHLKNEGVNDPTIDLFLEVLDPAGESPESVKRVKAALDAGADGSMTDGALLAKYEAHLRNFVPSDKVK
jgi:hypothetical protein